MTSHPATRPARSALSNPAPASLLACALLAACGGDAAEEAITGTRARFDAKALTVSGDFFALPFPNDLRRDGVGLSLFGFPNPKKSALLDSYTAALHDSVVGFGTASALFVSFDGPLDPSTLPSSADTLTPASPVQLIDLDQFGATMGERIPLELRYTDAASLFLPPHTLAMRPVPGFPLRAAHRYALVLTDGLKDTAGAKIVADALTRRVLGRWPAKDGSEVPAAVTAPFLLWAHGVGFPTDPLVLVSAFTVQDSVGLMTALRDATLATAAPSPAGLAFNPDSSGKPHLHLFTGTTPIPNFQKGTPPYLTTGGGIVVNAQGAPQVQRTEQVRFALTVPRGPAPAGGFPVVLYAHGTGGSYLSCWGEGLADDLAARGIATLTVDQVLHGPRNPGCNESDAAYESCVSTAYFNFTNPYSGRDNGRQGGVDLFQTTRLVGQLAISAALHPESIPVTLNPAKIAFLGHSQGGLTGAPFVAAETGLTGAAFSGTGGVLAITVLERTDPLNFKDLAETLLGIKGAEQLDPFHPALALMQTFAEPADPINYGRALQHEPLASGPRDLLLTEGMLDIYTVPHTSEALAAAAFLDLAGPVAHEGPGFLLRGLQALPLPVSANVQLGTAHRTGALLQFPTNDHFAIFDNAQARCRLMGFLTSSLAGAATIDACP
jgi:hypothetical protein